LISFDVEIDLSNWLKNNWDIPYIPATTIIPIIILVNGK
jgi:hypothetical protein